jgi:predicted Fe-Mo cluster-binding NifX family protein
LIIDLAENAEIERKELFLNEMPLTERLGLLRRMEVTIVICGGISETLHHMLQSCGIESINGITGEVEEVISAFRRNRLKDSKFFMPGGNLSD